MFKQDVQLKKKTPNNRNPNTILKIKPQRSFLKKKHLGVLNEKYLKNVTKNCTRSIKLLCCENAICKRKANAFYYLLKRKFMFKMHCCWDQQITMKYVFSQLTFLNTVLKKH